jgi:hypothetical protein
MGADCPVVREWQDGTRTPRTLHSSVHSSPSAIRITNSRQAVGPSPYRAHRGEKAAQHCQNPRLRHVKLSCIIIPAAWH